MPEFADALTAQLGGGVVTSEDLDRLWWTWFDDGYAARRGRDAFLTGLRTLDTGVPPAELGFRLGGWEVDLGQTVVQAGLVSVFLGAALAVLGADQVPVEVLPAVIPLVFDIRRSRLTASQEYVLAQLVLQPDVQAGPLSTSELYDRLPADVRADLSRVDFEDFLDACRRAGVADRDGDVTELTPTNRARFRITFR